MKKYKTEIRFVIDKSILENLSLDTSNQVKIIDYYFNRNKRIRYFKEYNNISKNNKYFLLEQPPGIVYKDYQPITESYAQSQAIPSNIQYLVNHTGLGCVNLNNNMKGYIEHLIIEDVKQKKTIIDELQIEFETYSDCIIELKELIKPIKIIEMGIYDYIQSKI